MIIFVLSFVVNRDHIACAFIFFVFLYVVSTVSNSMTRMSVKLAIIQFIEKNYWNVKNCKFHFGDISQQFDWQAQNEVFLLRCQFLWKSVLINCCRSQIIDLTMVVIEFDVMKTTHYRLYLTYLCTCGTLIFSTLIFSRFWLCVRNFFYLKTIQFHAVNAILLKISILQLKLKSYSKVYI